MESNFSLQLGKIDLFNAKVCRPLSRGVGVTTTESQMIYKRAKVEQVPLKLVQKLLEIVPYLDAFQKWIPSSSDTRLRTFETFWKRLNRSIFKLSGQEHFRDCESGQNGEGWFQLSRNIYISSRQ